MPVRADDTRDFRLVTRNKLFICLLPKPYMYFERRESHKFSFRVVTKQVFWDFKDDIDSELGGGEFILPLISFLHLQLHLSGAPNEHKF